MLQTALPGRPGSHRVPIPNDALVIVLYDDDKAGQEAEVAQGDNNIAADNNNEVI